MTQNIPLDRGDPAIEPFFDAVQEVLGASAPSFYLTVLNSTTIRAVGGTENALNAIAIEGRYRWRTTTVDAAHPGGAAGTYDVWVTGSDNSFTSVPTEDKTVYAWGLSILATGGSPGTAISRKVAEVEWSGTAITALRHLTGVRRDDAPVFAQAPIAALTPLQVRGASSQSASLLTIGNSAGSTLVSVGASGGFFTSQGITDTSTGGITASGAGGKTTLKLTSTSSNTGLTLGTDTTLYRSVGGTLKTDGNLIVTGMVTPGSLSSESVSTSALAAGSVTEAKLASEAVTTAKLANLAVTEPKLGDGAVSSRKLKPTTGQVNASASLVTTATATLIPGLVFEITPPVASVIWLKCQFYKVNVGTGTLFFFDNGVQIPSSGFFYHAEEGSYYTEWRLPATAALHKIEVRAVQGGGSSTIFGPSADTRLMWEVVSS